MDYLTWAGLLLALAALLSISQRSLHLAMFAAALFLGLFTLPPGTWASRSSRSSATRGSCSWPQSWRSSP